MKKLLLVIISSILVLSCAKNTDVERKSATKHTEEMQKKVSNYLPLSDQRDFENAQKGFIANSEDTISFDFISNREAPSTVNPSLWRQSQLNNISGLFEVTPSIYQVRGFDLANITFIRGEKGWIVVDPLTSVESASKALELFKTHKGNDPITGIIFTHSHIDHFGGVKGIVSQQDIDAGVAVVAPEHFFEESVSENLLAGNAMSRRASYMYGNLLPKDEQGTVDAGLGKGVAVGMPSIVRPTKVISKDYERYTIDGVEFEFLMAQNTEAPAEFMFYIPKYRAASSAEVINHTLHNLSTLRGAKTRNSLTWADSITRSKKFLQNRVDVLFGSHHWPTWGQETIDVFLSKHGDLYQYIHDQTLRLANMGYTLLEIPELIVIPDSLAKEFYNRGYYGSITHNVKAVYDFYFGAWWDGNPANLYKHQPEEAAKRYVTFMGGENNILRMAKSAYDTGDYRWVVEVLNHVIFSNPKNQKARNLSADAMEQLGYQSESAVWRAYFLTGALELRHGVQNLPTPQTSSPDMIQSLPISDFLKYLAVRLNPDKVKDKEFTLNVTIGGEKYFITTQNSVLKFENTHNQQAEIAVSMERNTFNQILLKQISLQDAVNTDITVTNSEKLLEFMSLFDEFEFWFNVVLP
ncbi:MAG: alkyl/aryl-sulfatase [Treponemataceae bacterium]